MLLIATMYIYIYIYYWWRVHEENNCNVSILDYVTQWSPCKYIYCLLSNGGNQSINNWQRVIEGIFFVWFVFFVLFVQEGVYMASYMWWRQPVIQPQSLHTNIHILGVSLHRH